MRADRSRVYSRKRSRTSKLPEAIDECGRTKLRFPELRGGPERNSNATRHLRDHEHPASKLRNEMSRTTKWRKRLSSPATPRLPRQHNFSAMSRQGRSGFGLTKARCVISRRPVRLKPQAMPVKQSARKVSSEKAPTDSTRLSQISRSTFSGIIASNSKSSR